MNSTVENYRLNIDQVDNGYIIITDNNNASSKIFEKLEGLLKYVKTFFEIGEKTRNKI